MAKQIIDIGSAPNDGTGDPLRTAFDKLNANNSELYIDKHAHANQGTLDATEEAFTTTLKNKLDGIEAGATNVIYEETITEATDTIDIPASVLGGRVYELDIEAVGGAEGVISLYVNEEYTDANYNCQLDQGHGSTEYADGIPSTSRLGYVYLNKVTYLSTDARIVNSRFVTTSLESRQGTSDSLTSSANIFMMNDVDTITSIDALRLKGSVTNLFGVGTIIRLIDPYAAYAVQTGVVGREITKNTAYTSHSTLMYYDDTIPQNTEGSEIMTINYTPQYADSILKIEVLCNVTTQVASNVIIGALFKDSEAGAFAANSAYVQTNDFNAQFKLEAEVSANSTATRTYAFRLGGHTAGSIYVNGGASARRFGGVQVSHIRVTEERT